MDVICETSLSSLYQYYSNMKYFGHYSIQEIDDMFPFERDVYFGLLSKTIDEQNKERKKKTR